MPSDIQELRDHYTKCMDLAHEWGLEPYEVDFHIVPSDKMYEIASYGVPGHFSHWTYGRNYWKQKTSYDYGHSKIYELVINSDPAQAFLLDVNSTLENMFVIAHVIGHSDYFANNAYFAHTNRSIENSVAATADRFREYELKYGRVVVEDFIDQVMSISEHIDPHLRTKKITSEYKKAHRTDKYMDLFPDEEAEIVEAERLETLNREKHFPSEPDRDLLLFIANHGRLEPWQKDVMHALRDEAIYFLPQMQTKIMNEGWASLIHHKLMHETDPECDPGGISFAGLHSSVLHGGQGALNPYWLGFKMYEHIIDRWDNPTDDERKDFAMIGKEGWDKVLEVRAVDSDESFIRNYLDKKLVEDLNLFGFGHNNPKKRWEVTDTEWEDVRDTLVAAKANMGQPYIEVVDGDYRRSGYLYLVHRYDGRDLHEKYAVETLKSVTALWGTDVFLETTMENASIVFKGSFDDDDQVIIQKMEKNT